MIRTTYLLIAFLTGLALLCLCACETSSDQETTPRPIISSQSRSSTVSPVLSTPFATAPAPTAISAQVTATPSAQPPIAVAGRYYPPTFQKYRPHNFDQCIQDATRVIASDPTTADAYFLRGNCHLEKGELDLAAADFSQAIQVQANYEPAYVDRGVVYLQQKSYAPALADFDHGATLNPVDPHIYFDRGSLYWLQQDDNHALEEFTTAIQLKPDFAEAYLKRGLLQTELHKYNQAIEDLSEAIQLRPSAANVYANRGVAYYYTGDFAQAIADEDTALRMYPDDEFSHYWRGMANRAAGNCRDALDDFIQATFGTTDLDSRAQSQKELQTLHCIADPSTPADLAKDQAAVASVIDQFMQAGARNDPQAGYDLFSPVVSGTVGIADVTSFFSTHREYFNNYKSVELGIASVVTNMNLTGRTAKTSASADTAVTFQQGLPIGLIVHLIKEGDQWKLISIHFPQILLGRETG
jgi:tetratricopeptide (TPR) repeat protein